ncbi:MAG TPA: hypothetical protein VMF91_02395, partial [Bryobacteraceae bacterium]|nr:hypothetical protein [Bryobacteraceae bacterium]
FIRFNVAKMPAADRDELTSFLFFYWQCGHSSACSGAEKSLHLSMNSEPGGVKPRAERRISLFYGLMEILAGWRNWQTQGSQNRLSAKQTPYKQLNINSLV